MLLLGIETATDVCSAALLSDGRLLAEGSIHRPRSHAARLVPLIQELLAHSDRRPTDLDAIAVSAGPGSYTGLRIGASAAKGLAVAADAALVAVPTLEAMAAAALPFAEEGNAIVAASNSRRGEVYAAAYRAGADGLAPLLDVAALSHDALGDWLPEADALWVVGEAAEGVQSAVPERTLRRVDAHPSATRVAHLGLRRFNAGQAENVAVWEPFYLKAFVAKPPRPIFASPDAG